MTTFLACPVGQYGKDCKRSCGTCGDGEICDPAHGCCSPDDEGFCGVAYAEQQLIFSSSTKKIGFSVTLLILVVVFLSLMVFYYRRKYSKRKEIFSPTVKYDPDADDDVDNRVFNPSFYSHVGDFHQEPEPEQVNLKPEQPRSSKPQSKNYF